MESVVVVPPVERQHGGAGALGEGVSALLIGSFAGASCGLDLASCRG